MRQAVVDFDDEVIAEWGFEAFRDAGIRDAEILSCEGPSGVVRIRVEDELDGGCLDGMDAVRWWERVSDEGSGYVYLVGACTAESGDTTGADVDRFPRTERVEVNGRGVTLTYTGSQERIGEEIAALEAAGIDVALRELRGYRVRETPLDALTERQREVLEVALDRGYYDVPRSATTKEIAAEFGLDDSTVSEHLRRAERNLVGTVLGRSL